MDAWLNTYVLLASCTSWRGSGGGSATAVGLGTNVGRSSLTQLLSLDSAHPLAQCTKAAQGVAYVLLLHCDGCTAADVAT